MRELKITLYGDPRTKKNSQRIVHCGRYPRLLPSDAYVDYSEDCLKQITARYKLKISEPVNVKCLYYMRTRRKVDLVNLQEATCDILVAAGVLKDDNSKIIVSMDGSRVYHDKENPRAEVTITAEKER